MFLSYLSFTHLSVLLNALFKHSARDRQAKLISGVTNRELNHTKLQTKAGL